MKPDRSDKRSKEQQPAKSVRILLDKKKEAPADLVNRWKEYRKDVGY